jgi:hypothetical protein
VEEIIAGKTIQDLKEGVPPWQVLHMSLYEVTLPHQKKEDQSRSLTELFAVMQQFFAGMRSIGRLTKEHYVLELAVAAASDDIVIYVSVPNAHVDLFEKQILSLFPGARLELQVHDYNIFVQDGTHVLATAQLKKHPIYPIRHNDQFQSDPLMVLLNSLSKIERDHGGAALQVVIKPQEEAYLGNYKKIIERIENGMKPKDSIAKSTLGGEMMFTMKDMFAGSHKDNDTKEKRVDTDALELFRTKIAYPVVDTNIRLVVSGNTPERAHQILSEMESTLNQFNDVRSNQFTFTRPKGTSLQTAIKAFSFRQFDKKTSVPLWVIELASLFVFPDIVCFIISCPSPGVFATGRLSKGVRGRVNLSPKGSRVEFH